MKKLPAKALTFLFVLALILVIAASLSDILRSHH